MGEQHRKQADPPGAVGDIAERVVGFELGEDPLLAAPAVVEGERLTNREKSTPPLWRSATGGLDTHDLLEKMVN